MKKGLSPLIATVLLIGITISLAALVMVWGQQLFSTTTEETGESAAAEIDCISRVQVEILSAVCGVAGNMDVAVDNVNEKPIDAFIVRYFDAGTGVETVQFPVPPATMTPLAAFNANTYTVPVTIASVVRVEVIPQMLLANGNLHACGQRIATFNTPTISC